MARFLFNSAWLLFLLQLTAFGSDAPNGTKDLSAAKSSEEVAEELKKKYPVSEWKTIGFVGYQREPLAELKVPPFLKWNEDCNLHTVKNGIEYCGPNDVMSHLIGTAMVDGKERIIRVSMEIFARDKIREIYVRYQNFTAWKEVDAVQSMNEIYLGGETAYLAEVEDLTGKPTRFQIKVMTLIKFEHPYVGGTVYFIETENDEDGGRFVPHKDRVYQWAIDEMIKSFRFTVDVNKPHKNPRKKTVKKSAAKESKSKSKKAAQK